MENDGEDVVPHVHSAWCLLISTIVLAVTVILTSSIRSVIRAKCSETLPTLCLLDLLCGLELCMCGFELGVILDIYDTPVYCVYLWIVLMWQGMSWAGSTPSTHTHLVRYMSQCQSLYHTVTRSLAGATGALLSYSAMSVVWQYDLSHYHDDREMVTAAGHCNDDLQVSVPAGVLIEMLGSTICFMTGSLLVDMPVTGDNPTLALSVDSIVGVGMVMAGFDLTGYL